MVGHPPPAGPQAAVLTRPGRRALAPPNPANEELHIRLWPGWPDRNDDQLPAGRHERARVPRLGRRHCGDLGGSPMRTDAAELIERWFLEHRDDGEFAFETGPGTFSVVAPRSGTAGIILATKGALVASAIRACAGGTDVGMIARYGLWHHAEIAWIRKAAANHPLLFLGDMDPADLMIFCWLRLRLRPKRIQHLGVNDAYLDALGVDLPRPFIMRRSPSERKSRPVLARVLPDLRDVVGDEMLETTGSRAKDRARCGRQRCWGCRPDLATCAPIATAAARKAERLAALLDVRG